MYAFGSSTPRVLGYLEHLDKELKIYDSKLKNTSAPIDMSSRSSLDGTGRSSQLRAIKSPKFAFGSTIRDETAKSLLFVF